jgi:hypothetical protein
VTAGFPLASFISVALVRSLFRFQLPPVEPCMRLSGSKLSARTSPPQAGRVTFLKAALRSRTVGFPESGSDVMKERGLRSSCPSRACMLGVLTQLRRRRPL